MKIRLVFLAFAVLLFSVSFMEAAPTAIPLRGGLPILAYKKKPVSGTHFSLQLHDTNEVAIDSSHGVSLDVMNVGTDKVAFRFLIDSDYSKELNITFSFDELKCSSFVLTCDVSSRTESRQGEGNFDARLTDTWGIVTGHDAGRLPYSIQASGRILVRLPNGTRTGYWLPARYLRSGEVMMRIDPVAWDTVRKGVYTCDVRVLVTVIE